MILVQPNFSIPKVTLKPFIVIANLSDSHRKCPLTQGMVKYLRDLSVELFLTQHDEILSGIKSSFYFQNKTFETQMQQLSVSAHMES